MAWGITDIPSQSGRLAVVTGGNGGLGLETARALARAGAEVVIAARNPEKAAGALADIRSSNPEARVSAEALDLSQLASVRDFVSRWLRERGPLDLLVNNAGIMAIPHARSADGFEMQLATNHIGHFALTLGLMPALQASAAGRVVTVASAMHLIGRIRFDDIDGDKGYSPWLWYGQSKLANLLFTAELDRRLRKARSKVSALAAHPGYAATDLQHVAPKARGAVLESAIMTIGNAAFAQSAAAGALPTLRAATDPGAQGGQYYGPRWLGWFGDPVVVGRSRGARDETVAERLWALSEERSGLSLALA